MPPVYWPGICARVGDRACRAIAGGLCGHTPPPLPQESDRMSFVIMKEEQEAKRKRIEAQGIGLDAASAVLPLQYSQC